MSKGQETARKYDGTVARIAGNLLSGMEAVYQGDGIDVSFVVHAVRNAVMVARAIVAEVERTEPERCPR